MKSNALTLFLLCGLSFFITKKTNAKEITTYYHRSCIIGCGDVSVTRSPSILTYPDGTTEAVTLRSVDCRGIGFNSCPSHKLAPLTGPQHWIEEANDNLLEHALSAISNGNGAGTHHQTVYNVETGKSITLYVDWHTTYDQNGNKASETIEIYYNN
jgi:hypothetical protein